MKYIPTLTARDQELAASLAGFIPATVFDIHAHPYAARHFLPGDWKFLDGIEQLGCADHRSALQRYLPAATVHGLYFGMPRPGADRPALNAWVAEEVRDHGTELSRALLLVSPADDPATVGAALRCGRYCGLKVYHCYAPRPDTMNARVEEYAPEWMWELLDETSGILMLHLVKDGAIEHADNQRSLRRLCRRYPKARVILAHIARCFSYRNARAGLHSLIDLDNVVVDTSAVCETESFRVALETLGPRRVLWGSDFAVSELRGRCVTTGNLFFWLHPELLRPEYQTATTSDLTLVGIESLLSLREACDDCGLTGGEIADLFSGNARRILAGHIPADATPAAADGPALWRRARTVIAGGTGLLSKRAEMFDAQTWPAYFSRCRGCEVWDLDGHRYLDFVGGVGAVLLGYADPAVTAAVRRRLAAGTYCSLVSPEEVELAERLLHLHPWAGKVRYARGGGEAMTMAVRIARAATGNSGVAFCGYHGWHDWYLAANLGASDALDGHLLPGLDPTGVPRELRGTAQTFRYNDLPSLDAALARLAGNVAAVVMEPMRSQWPQDDFVQQAAARCRAAGAVFIVDEVTSGLRYGFPGALAQLGVEPDIAVYAKAMSNGFPFGAVVGRESVMSAAERSFISSSYWTDGVGPAAALAVLDKVQRLQVQPVIWERGVRLQRQLREAAARQPLCRITISGQPPTPHLAFGLGADSPAALTCFVRAMRSRRFLAAGYIYVMLAHEDAKLDSFVAAAEESWSELSRLIAAGGLAEAAAVTATPGFARLA